MVGGAASQLIAAPLAASRRPRGLPIPLGLSHVALPLIRRTSAKRPSIDSASIMLSLARLTMPDNLRFKSVAVAAGSVTRAISALPTR